jgi:hypothetical protein
MIKLTSWGLTNRYTAAVLDLDLNVLASLPRLQVLHHVLAGPFLHS